MEVSCVLAKWYLENKRDLPWRSERSPYKIWLSEVILQQTRINQGIGYYNRFVTKYPAVTQLAMASDDEVLKLWQGLGYYTRARNMLATARNIVKEHDGKFPGRFEDLLKLKGIGHYTAAAVASMAFGQPVAVVDGNVYRVISRLFAVTIPVNSTEGKRWFLEKAERLLDRENPGIHNQAMMEFGALVCLPKSPKCDDCVLSSICQARIRNIVSELPVKKPKTKPRIRYFNYLFVEYNGKTLLKKRNGSDIWHSLYEFPMIESSGPLPYSELLAHPLWQSVTDQIPCVHEDVKTYEHKLTHQTLQCSFIRVSLQSEPQDHEYIVADIDHLQDYAVPKVIERFIQSLK